ncbi:MAG: MBL fold metallo-hydrolase [Hyphomicrobiaceae bacterium]|nr:MBL fold metallo-hydrolase [Hyphomicrobiaceae bacterium]
MTRTPMDATPTDAELVFKKTMTFEYARPMGMLPGIVRIVADNPGPFTFKGTNTYLVGSTELAVIDPGPDDPRHVDAILEAAGGRPITHVFVTHTHRDHVDGLPRLKAATGARSCGHGRAHLDLPSVLTSPSGREFIDPDFCPDIQLGHGDCIEGADWTLEAIHTPGHAPDHLCFELRSRGVIFSGDHVMAWSTTVVAPPEGNMHDYMASLEVLLARPVDLYLPGHGGRLECAQRSVRAYLVHRRWREQAILGAIRSGVSSISGVVGLIYRNVDPKLAMAARLSVQAHVEHLAARGHVTFEAPLGFDSVVTATAAV